MALTISLLVVIGLLALLGLLRGVRAGLVAIAGTLLAAVLVDLWGERLALWLRTTLRPERPALPVFLLIAAVFLLTALVIGFGSNALLPRAGAATTRRAVIADRLLGALLGALNGALIGSYLLRYAQAAWPDRTVANLVAASPVAGVLVLWLPWFVLAMVVTSGLVVLVRVTATQVRRRAAARAAAPAPTPAVPAGGGAGVGGAPPPTSSVANAKSLGEADRKLNDKIDQALGKK